jgi:hypothetical protein
MSRPDIVKNIWAYIKSKDMQDPSDRRFILCDELLKNVMGGKARISGFEMNKYISKHVAYPEELVDPPKKRQKKSAPTENFDNESDVVESSDDNESESASEQQDSAMHPSRPASSQSSVVESTVSNTVNSSEASLLAPKPDLLVLGQRGSEKLNEPSIPETAATGRQSNENVSK